MPVNNSNDDNEINNSSNKSAQDMEGGYTNETTDDPYENSRQSREDGTIRSTDGGLAIETGTSDDTGRSSTKDRPTSHSDGDGDSEKDEKMEDDLEHKVEAIDRVEAATTPALQRNIGFTSTPGAFRASPARGLHRVTTIGSAASIGDSVSRGGGFLPPIEAVLVDNSALSDGRQRNRRADDDDTVNSMGVFTAEPLASIKEFVSTTPRYILIGLAVLCMVMVTTVAAAVLATQLGKPNDQGSPTSGDTVLVPIDGSSTKPDEKESKLTATFYTFHAVIFGSNFVGSPALAKCNHHILDGDNDDDDLMTIRISCEGDNASLMLHKIWGNATCLENAETSASNVTHEQNCTLPYDEISYVSFDCATSTPSRPGNKTARVAMINHPSTVVHENTAAAACEGIDDDQVYENHTIEAFFYLQRVCRFDQIVSDQNECVVESTFPNHGPPISTTFGGKCTTPLFLYRNISDGDDAGCTSTTDCGEMPARLSVDDQAACPMDDPPDQGPHDETILESIWIENVTSIQLQLY